MEGFFGLLKKEFWHGRDCSDWIPARFIEELGGWIGRYNTERRSDALGGRTPAEFRSALGGPRNGSRNRPQSPFLPLWDSFLLGRACPNPC